MSSAYNHMKRSHRSNYRTRAYTGGRKSVITPTLSKTKQMQFIKLIRQFLEKRKEQKNQES